MVNSHQFWTVETLNVTFPLNVKVMSETFVISNMKSRRSPFHSALEDVSKEPEPPPKPIFCCMRNLRNSIVLTTFYIAPNSKIVEATIRFCGEKKKKPPDQTFLGRKVNQAVSFLFTWIQFNDRHVCNQWKFTELQTFWPSSVKTWTFVL